MYLDDDYYNQGEHDNFDAFSIQEEEQEQEELPGVNELKEDDASFDDWEEGEVPSNPIFNEEFKKQQLDLRRKEMSWRRYLKLSRRKLSCLNLKNEEK